MSSPDTLDSILDATWRDGAQLASPSYLKDADGKPLPAISVATAQEMVRDELLAMIGPNEPVDYFNKNPDRSIRPEARNQVRDELRAKVREWSGII
ncbi:hypothetical protein RCF27_09285 [Rhodococcus pyridinivorans]|uniref:hypothetical protein n=1 Tax=Rhodococcus pyridinivorans TaxID=103816 RepID=UPI00280AF145|nr:hypothetical protein [Rhodococcus pyridinivorans]WMM74451.1 hypothetical protein RCF27_09285 [Rhodococcus pyridinivorans]